MSRSRSCPLRAFITVVAAVVFGHGSSAALAGDCWQPPVPAPVTDPYREPACRWCPGNRGIEYATATGTPVRAVAAGTVGFAGVIAGERYVVVRHADGRRATYGGLADARFGTGDLVVAGTVVGTTTTRFHFGLRDGDAYVDPTPLLGQLVYRTRLVPSDGAAPAPAGPPRLRCGVATRPSSAVRPGRTPAGAV